MHQLSIVLPLLFLVQNFGGRPLTLNGRDFSFHILEPPGWQLDTRAAPQISNFIFRPVGSDWRRADAVIFARFVEREPGITLEEFARASREQFEADCPFADEAEDAPIELSGFEVQEFLCPGVSHEIVASRPGPRFFVVLVLSLRTENAANNALTAFQQIADSFEWIERPVIDRP